MKKILSVLIVLFFIAQSQQAGEVTPAAAGKAAVQFITAQAPSAHEAPSTLFSVREIVPYSSEGEVIWHIVNLEPQGWVIIAADDAVPPVLAYSYSGSFSAEASPESCTAWMGQYHDQIRHVRLNPDAILPVTSGLWKALLNPQTGADQSRTVTGIAPLTTSNWNQNYPYNAECPADPAGPGGHAYAGCVPTCMGQVMYYFRWPWTGTGSYSYYDSTYGTLTAVFDTTTYDWNRMTDVADGINPAIALLLYHLGVSCDLVYGPDGSGMYNHKAAYALKTHFKYNPKTQYVFRDSTAMDWDSLLIDHLERKVPMYYAGWSVPNINGHAFVCDGYQDSCYFHFNFGWGGQSNGYFYTSDLIVGGNNFNLAQEVIINCWPDSALYNYPLYCSGDQEFHNQQGTFEDGSGPLAGYLPSSSCSWLIDPQTETDSVTRINLTFKRFQTNPGDVVTVYDGSGPEAPLLAVLSGDTLPAVISSTGNRLYAEMMSGAGSSGPGFFAGYESDVPVWCTGTSEIVADTAIFSDGSLRFNYHNGQVCRWKVATASGGPLTLNFRSFDTEEDKDLLKIYDFGSSSLITELSGSFHPDSLPPPVTVESGVAFLVFTTNATVTGQGWEIYYPKSTQGLEEVPVIPVAMSPNPSDGPVTLSVHMPKASEARILLLHMDGTLVLEQPVLLASGANRIPLDLSGRPAGVYLVRILTTQGSAQGKMVIY